MGGARLRKAFRVQEALSQRTGGCGRAGPRGGPRRRRAWCRNGLGPTSGHDLPRCVERRAGVRLHDAGLHFDGQRRAQRHLQFGGSGKLAGEVDGGVDYASNGTGNAPAGFALFASADEANVDNTIPEGTPRRRTRGRSRRTSRASASTPTRRPTRRQAVATTTARRAPGSVPPGRSTPRDAS